MQKLFFTFLLCATSVFGMEHPENHLWDAEPATGKTVVARCSPVDVRFPVAVAENAPTCVYAAFNLISKHDPQICWDSDSDQKTSVDVPHLDDGLYIPSQRPLITPDGACVFGRYALSDKRYTMVLHYRDIDKGKAQYVVDFGNYYDDINVHNKPVIDTDIPYACLFDAERVFFRLLKSVFICTLAALKNNEKDLFKVPAYKRKDIEYYPSFERKFPRMKPCYRIGENTMLLIGPECKSLEVLHCDKNTCSLAAERTFDTDIVDVSASSVRGIVSVRLYYEDAVQIFDSMLNLLGKIYFNTAHGIIPQQDLDRVFTLAPSGNYVAYNLTRKNAKPYVWDGSQVIVIVDCANIKKPQEVIIIPEMCCEEMLWSNQGLFLHTGSGSGGRLVFSNT